MAARAVAARAGRAIAAAVLLATAWPAPAAETLPDPCGPGATAAECLCRQEPPARAVHLPQLRAGALDVRRALCEGEADLRGVLGRIDALLRDTQGWSEPYGGFVAAGEPAGANRAILDRIDAGRGVPTVTVTRTDDLLVGGDLILEPADRAACDARAATRRAGAACVDVLDEFAAFYGHAQATYASESALAFARYAATLRGDWEDYLGQARSQTVLELAVNSYLYRRNEEARFTPPPDWQLILLHPGVVLEHVDGANDGERFREGLMLELIGANYWRQDRWYLPFGGSLITTYSDRAAVDDWGYGLALHFANAYTLGASRRGGETGWFLSLDLLKLFADQRNTLEAFGR
ncbi:MAG: hypothetical protein U5K43_13480 [Halofilum sp. (in: g-proteobacteria)]|nr:hypothetical protein [Halofilum sp. (in: g-proteobacteria)]